MKKFLRHTLYYFAFWLTYFWLAKVMFLLFNYGQSHLLTYKEIAGIFYHGLVMDVSMTCYLLAIPMLALVIPAVPPRLISRFVYVYTFTLVTIASLLTALDLGLYPHWGTRVNVTIFNYINDPVAMSSSIMVSDLLQSLLVVATLFLIFRILYRKLFPNGFHVDEKITWKKFLIQLFLTSLLIIPIRGGFNTSPLNHSSVAFSPKLFVNQSATNYLWNFTKSVLKRKRTNNLCIYMPKEEAEILFENLMSDRLPVNKPQLIRQIPGNKPNVVLVILESFSNKVIAPLGGMHGIAPRLDSLCTKSTVFTNFYATGNRSDRGISAIMGGYPSLLATSIMVYPEKSKGLTLLPEYLNRQGYHTSFYYGGDINFYNLRTFVLQSNCATMVTKSEFPVKLGLMSKWGVPDEYLFQRAFDDIKTTSEPFLTTIYTVSSHQPYDVPFSKIKGNSVDDKYLNSVAYTDSCLGVFVDKLRELPIWKNTLLIVTADHGTVSPGPTDITETASYRIPLIWSGGVVDSLRRIDTITQQTDFGASLMRQLGWEPDQSKFTRDFFAPNPFAFYMLDTGWGLVTPDGEYYFDQNTKTFARKPEKAPEEVAEKAKAYIQILHEDFINR